jgi:DNA-binding CsgD family transcriptional regulator
MGSSTRKRLSFFSSNFGTEQAPLIRRCPFCDARVLVGPLPPCRGDAPPRSYRRRNQTLTTAEARVLALLPSTLTQREMARELYLSVNTVKSHVQEIYGKFGVRTRADAVAHAQALGLLG